MEICKYKIFQRGALRRGEERGAERGGYTSVYPSVGSSGSM